MRVMKKRNSIRIIAIAFALAAVSALWYCLPTTFLDGVEPSDVKFISVFDGNTGAGFEISDADEIRYIVEHIQSVKMKKDELSIGRLGYCFRMRFYGVTGKEIESFIINGSNTIRKDPFFYRGDGDVGFDYLRELEAKYSG